MRKHQPLPRLGAWRDELERLLATNATKPSPERLTLIRISILSSRWPARRRRAGRRARSRTRSGCARALLHAEAPLQKPGGTQRLAARPCIAVREGLAKPELVQRAQRRQPEDRLMTLVRRHCHFRSGPQSAGDRGTARDNAGADAGRRLAMGGLVGRASARSRGASRFNGARTR